MAAYPVRREHVEGVIQAGARRVSTKASSAMPSAAKACHDIRNWKGFAGSGQPILLDAKTHDPFGKSQLSCGGGTVALVHLEGVDNQLFFQHGQLHVEGPGPPIVDLGHLKAGRKQPGVDDLSVGEQYGPLNGVLELPDISRPVIGHQQIDCWSGQPHDGSVMPPAVFLDEMIRQKDDVGTAIPQRRHMNREYVETIVEIGSEPTVFHVPLKRTVCRGHHADVGRQDLGPADPLEFPLL